MVWGVSTRGGVGLGAADRLGVRALAGDHDLIDDGAGGLCGEPLRRQGEDGGRAEQRRHEGRTLEEFERRHLGSPTCELFAGPKAATAKLQAIIKSNSVRRAEL